MAPGLVGMSSIPRGEIRQCRRPDRSDNLTCTGREHTVMGWRVAHDYLHSYFVEVTHAKNSPSLNSANSPPNIFWRINLANLIRVVLFQLSLSWPSALEVPF